MAATMDMSLDDIIKKNRERGRGRGRASRGRGRGLARSFNNGRMSGPYHRGPLSVNARPSKYSIAKASSKLWMVYAYDSEPSRSDMTASLDGKIMMDPPVMCGISSVRELVSPSSWCFCKGVPSLNFRTGAPTYIISLPSRRVRSLPWQHDLLEDSIRAAGITGVEVGTKIYVSNLDYGVTNEDIRVQLKLYELFAEVGDLKRYAVHYDKDGRSSGSAEVLYTRRSDAFGALKKYNNVLLDGKPMKIEIVGANPVVPISARMNVTGANGKKKRTFAMIPGLGGGRGAAVNNRGSGWGRDAQGLDRDLVLIKFWMLGGQAGIRGMRRVLVEMPLSRIKWNRELRRNKMKD
ncbi:hypothetical protein SADUNF_Sadunf17G0119000 [Salix dunnii]|uniref:RRM domain-containing protein n=1 Tax=Salix dunnii TaxID=1413687 RepID=A0A835J630_9ROSI|nr:hypothetical protein SADUNF_Sadunf17G0119000 [Salix dunnii]